MKMKYTLEELAETIESLERSKETVRTCLEVYDQQENYEMISDVTDEE